MMIFSRAVAAIVGGYVLAHLVAILISYLLASPQNASSQANGVMVGMQVSYLVYAAAVMWVFTVKSVRKVWVGLLLSCLLSSALVWALMPEGLAL